MSDEHRVVSEQGSDADSVRWSEEGVWPMQSVTFIEGGEETLGGHAGVALPVRCTECGWNHVALIPEVTVVEIRAAEQRMSALHNETRRA